MVTRPGAWCLVVVVVVVVAEGYCASLGVEQFSQS